MTISACVTTSGPSSGKSCVFPFTYNGKSCPGPKCCNFDDNTKGGWCSTKVGDDGVYISGNYGYCAGTTCERGMCLVCVSTAVLECNIVAWDIVAWNIAVWDIVVWNIVVWDNVVVVVVVIIYLKMKFT